MRISDNPELAEGFFEGDLPNGHVKLECSKCRNVFENISEINEICCCPNCQTELFYRSYWEW